MRIGGGRIVWAFTIIAASAAAGMLLDWRAPGIGRYARDWLMRARGPLAAPDDIAIVAIDEASITRFGRFPWPRSLTARALDRIAAAEPKVVALDILYADPTSEADDAALAAAIQRAKNVITAAQLIDSPGAGAAWVRPLPPLAQAAAAVAHVNVSTEADAVARQLPLILADDAGRALRAMAVEAVRLGDGVREDAVTETRDRLFLGARTIPVETISPTLVVGAGRPAAVIRSGRMAIDYIGPPGSFSSHTYSFADVVSGGVAPANFHGKYVLLGATAASMSDRVSSPFVHASDSPLGRQGTLMPGVEVLANSLNTILRGRFYSEAPDSLAFLWAAAIAALTLVLLAAAEGRHPLVRQVGALAVAGATVIGGSYLAFTRALVFPPLVPAAVSFASAGVLGLLRRSLVTSARLDAAIGEISGAAGVLVPTASPAAAAESIAHLNGAPAVAILAPARPGRYRWLAGYGPFAKQLSAPAAPLPNGLENSAVSLDGGGLLLVAHEPGNAPAGDLLRLSKAIAASALERDDQPLRFSWLPRGIEWKARALQRLNGRFIHHARFIDWSMRSVEDGLLVAGVDGRIAFANPRAAAILGVPEQALRGRDLLERLGDTGATTTLVRLVLDRAVIEREITLRDHRARYYTLRLSAVAAGADSPVLGIVASLSDVTRQHELQQTKNDVVALVSHEMRTPLTAIQGMSELLAQFDVEPARRSEMHAAINDEVKRLTRMIDEYLDIARLESGRRPLQRAAVRIEPLIERVLLLLEPIAGQRNIRLARRFDGALPAVLGDAELLARAITNLVSNAVKYSPPATEVSVSATAGPDAIAIAVADQGYGIPESDLERIFEKFHRVPRVEDAGIAGTGLGLALVREIAELHGGSVIASSVPGAGSTFTLSIPRGT